MKEQTDPGAAGRIGPLRKSVTVRCSVEHAFHVFTEGIGTWWPLDRFSIGEQRAVNAVLEGRAGGRVYEVMKEGEEADWGRVLAWEPPHRLVVEWKPNSDPTPPTEWEATFTPVGENETRLDLEHRGWERLGGLGLQARAEYEGGWTGVLGLYAEAASPG
jgi:uncharacterized protein YndB with AHSA1/START domain